jgi:protein phosphatase
VRSNNEDSVYAGARLLALADGMGGHAAGEVASQLVIAALAHLDDDEPGGDLLAKLDEAVRAGNAAIAAQVEAEPELEGMGTTLTAILFAGDRIGLVHIGDSRGYLLRDGELFQMTQDHTMDELLKAEAEQAGQTADPAETSRLSHVLYRVLDGRDDREPDLRLREARLGDRYLLCSDGLSGPVEAQRIYELLSAEADPQRAVAALIEEARNNGGPDNITAVVADVVEAEYHADAGGPVVVGAAAQS